MGQAVEPVTAGGVAVFELERFGWVGPDRLEVYGRWYGLRARRFVRPTLFLNRKGERRRLLAVLDHKPWAALDGESWTAAFPWEGEPVGFDSAELAVATGIDIELPAPDPAAGSRSGRPRRFPYRAVSRGAPAPEADPPQAHGVVTEAPRPGGAAEADEQPAAQPSGEEGLSAEVERLRGRLAALEEEARHSAAIDTEMLEERDRLFAEQQEEAQATQRRLELELNRAREVLQDSLREARERERRAAEESEAASAAMRREHEQQVSSLRKEREHEVASLRKEHERALASLSHERDSLARDRDKALRQRDKASSELGEISAALDRLRAEHDEVVRERDRAMLRAGPRATWPEPERNLLEIWTPRLIAVGLLLVFLVTVLVLFGR